MKRLFSIALLALLLCAISASAPQPTHADDWVGELLTCTGNYIDGFNNAWDTWYASPQGPSDDSQRNYALDQSFNDYQGCNGIVNVPVQHPDFCTGAQQAYYNCGIQYQGLDASSALMECQLATQYDFRCR